ncbi:NAD-dependent epimerase/dehydratase family protein [Devosia submarina]|uniref:NAD-dependent epimerase/dehydratase family protein n=1 Tax=Devosia submarina TaxID=1173082 RepID=UPI000D3323F0|nr:NAD-dependent epimerase/dehydratase family protein [Devosia submarina]
MKIVVLGGDGFCGWPTALRLSRDGHSVTIVDNLSHRRIDQELGVQSLTPITAIEERLAAWQRVSGRTIAFQNIDIARDYDGLAAMLAEQAPDAVVHFAEQRAAPYSMRNAATKRYTIDNNINATHNLLVALVDLGFDTHLVHLGTMGVYGYDGDGLEIPEGYLDVTVSNQAGQSLPRSILYPTQPGSVYHLSKSLDQLLFQFYARNDRLRITDLHQGIVWGTQTEETRLDDALVNRFDYDGDYGTVLNRFLVQAVNGYPLTVHGSGGQTRAFINIQDTVRCVSLALNNPPPPGDRVRITNQLAETQSVRAVAAMVAGITGVPIANVDNPRKEGESNTLRASNQTFRGLGLDLILLKDALLNETLEIVERYKDRFNPEVVPARSLWTRDNRPGLVPGLGEGITK